MVLAWEATRARSTSATVPWAENRPVWPARLARLSRKVDGPTEGDEGNIANKRDVPLGISKVELPWRKTSSNLPNNAALDVRLPLGAFGHDPRTRRMIPEMCAERGMVRLLAGYVREVLSLGFTPLQGLTSVAWVGDYGHQPLPSCTLP